MSKKKLFLSTLVRRTLTSILDHFPSKFSSQIKPSLVALQSSPFAPHDRLSSIPTSYYSLGSLGFSGKSLCSKSAEKIQTSCWNCHAVPQSAPFVVCDSCQCIQPVDDSIDYFQIFGLEKKYDIEGENLESKYKEWQKIHPDLVHWKSQKERDFAAEQSTRVIEAYRTLSKPLSRAIYMLKLYGVDIDEEQAISEPELLAEVLDLDKDSTIESVRKIMDVLNEVGGACQRDMFSVSGSFEIAELVKGTARMKANHYNVLMRTICKRGDHERAEDLLKEMKRSGCNPNGVTYNLLLSCLCKNDKFAEAFQLLETMEKDHEVPDVSTFDIVVKFLCERQQFDLVLKMLDKMALKGIEACVSTHAAVIKSYFESGKYDEAHQYVVDCAGKMSYSSNANYSLLATLHLKKGNVLRAHEILCEMMDKGLKPNFSVYMKIMKRLEKKNKKCLSLELSRRYSSLIET